MLLTGVFFYAGGIAVRGAAVSQTCQSEGLGREPLISCSRPTDLLQNAQNPGKWPRFSLLHQVFKADFSATLTVIPPSGTDCIGRNGCFQLLRPTRQFLKGHFHNRNKTERKISPPLHPPKPSPYSTSEASFLNAGRALSMVSFATQ